jgi:hypothetical protein
MDPLSRFASREAAVCRRAFLQHAGLGFGTLALASLLRGDGLLAAELAAAGPGGSDLRPRPGHFPARARAVVLLLQVGGPSQVDLFDPKPELQKRDGQKHPERVESFQPGSQDNRLMASPFRFGKHGRCGMDFCQLLPHLGSVADELCMVRSMVSDNNNHPQATRCLNTGKIFPGRPTLGAWVSYALGTENQNLPAYVVLRDPDGYNNGGTTVWENGWLPALFRGTELQARGPAVLDLHPPAPLPDGVQRTNLEALAGLNEERRRLYPGESDLEARIRNYELAARMQLHAERLLDLSRESPATRTLYGLDDPLTANYGTRCLMARRLVEEGVRFVLVPAPIAAGTMPWDHHSDLKPGLAKVCPLVDRPSAAMVRDLKQRGLLDGTVVLWTGEFGRLPITQGGTGRDHNRHAFTLLLAGGGFKAGHVHGATDEFGYRAVEGQVSCPSLLATLLHQLGLDHTRLTYRHNGREETLTDAPVTRARVVTGLLERAPELREGGEEEKPGP